MKLQSVWAIALIACGGRIASNAEDQPTTAGGTSDLGAAQAEPAFRASEIDAARGRCSESFSADSVATEADLAGSWLVCRTGDALLLRGDKTVFVYAATAGLTATGRGTWSFESTDGLAKVSVSRSDGTAEALGQPYLQGGVLAVYEAQSREPRLFARLR